MMRKYAIILGVFLGTAQGSCPPLAPEIFQETLYNSKKKMVIDETHYKIKNRKKPQHSLESSYQPRIEVHKKRKRPTEMCHYIRRIGDKKFGSFILEEILPQKKYKPSQRGYEKNYYYPAQ